MNEEYIIENFFCFILYGAGDRSRAITLAPAPEHCMGGRYLSYYMALCS